MIIKIIERAKELISGKTELLSGSVALDFFLHHTSNLHPIENHIATFCLLDDFDVTSAIKNWMNHPDKILSNLCRFIIDRHLLKVNLQANPFSKKHVEELVYKICAELGINEEEARYFVFTGETTNTTYNTTDERINILFKDGSVKDISKVDNALIHQTLSSPVKKFYICYMR